MVSEGAASLCVTVPKGAKRVFVQYFNSAGAFETEFAGQRAVCNTAPLGWPKAMWFRVHTGAPLAEDTQLKITTHAAGNVIFLGVLASF